MKTLTQTVSEFGVVLSLAFTLLFVAAPAQAAITQADIDNQKIEVQKSMIELLRQEVRLLQLVLVNKLEVEVAILQAKIEAQK